MTTWIANHKALLAALAAAAAAAAPAVPPPYNAVVYAVAVVLGSYAGTKIAVNAHLESMATGRR
jgi:hypothetical protein